MGEKLTWDEIKKRFPDEWVVLTDCVTEGDVPQVGVVIDHGKVKKDVYQRLRLIVEECTVLYTGKIRRGLVLGGLYAVGVDDEDRAA